MRINGLTALLLAVLAALMLTVFYQLGELFLGHF
jgi:hypothetical protein